MHKNPSAALSSLPAPEDLLFPKKCVFCGGLLEDGKASVCEGCMQILPTRSGSARVIDAGGFPCALPFYYEPPVSTGIRAMKFHGLPSRCKAFSIYIAEAAKEQLGDTFDTVAYVPISTIRNLNRGFDQSALLAKGVAAALGLPFVKALWKTRNNTAQSSVKLPEDRRKNVENVYSVRPNAPVAGRRFLLIDDVCTTGSTLASAAGVLMEGGALSVVCAVLAGGHPENPTELGL